MQTRGNIKVDLKDTVCEIVEWIQLAQNKIQGYDFVKALINPRVQQKQKIF